eukprot:gene8639-214_t
MEDTKRTPFSQVPQASNNSKTNNRRESRSWVVADKENKGSAGSEYPAADPQGTRSSTQTSFPRKLSALARRKKKSRMKSPRKSAGSLVMPDDVCPDPVESSQKSSDCNVDDRFQRLTWLVRYRDIGHHILPMIQRTPGYIETSLFDQSEADCLFCGMDAEDHPTADDCLAVCARPSDASAWTVTAAWLDRLLHHQCEAEKDEDEESLMHIHAIVDQLLMLGNQKNLQLMLCKENLIPVIGCLEMHPIYGYRCHRTVINGFSRVNTVEMGDTQEELCFMIHCLDFLKDSVLAVVCDENKYAAYNNHTANVKAQLCREFLHDAVFWDRVLCLPEESPACRLKFVQDLTSLFSSFSTDSHAYIEKMYVTGIIDVIGECLTSEEGTVPEAHAPNGVLGEAARLLVQLTEYENFPSDEIKLSHHVAGRNGFVSAVVHAMEKAPDSVRVELMDVICAIMGSDQIVPEVAQALPQLASNCETDADLASYCFTLMGHCVSHYRPADAASESSLNHKILEGADQMLDVCSFILSASADPQKYKWKPRRDLVLASVRFVGTLLEVGPSECAQFVVNRGLVHLLVRHLGMANAEGLLCSTVMYVIDLIQKSNMQCIVEEMVTNHTDDLVDISHNASKSWVYADVLQSFQQLYTNNRKYS